MRARKRARVPRGIAQDDKRERTHTRIEDAWERRKLGFSTNALRNKLEGGIIYTCTY